MIDVVIPLVDKLNLLNCACTHSYPYCTLCVRDSVYEQYADSFPFCRLRSFVYDEPTSIIIIKHWCRNEQYHKSSRNCSAEKNKSGEKNRENILQFARRSDINMLLTRCVYTTTHFCVWMYYCTFGIGSNLHIVDKRAPWNGGRFES